MFSWDLSGGSEINQDNPKPMQPSCLLRPETVFTRLVLMQLFWCGHTGSTLNVISSGIIFFCGVAAPTRSRAPTFMGLLHHTQRRTTVGCTPPDELSARHRYHHLTTHYTHNRQSSMTQVGFEPAIPQASGSDHALNRTSTGTEI